MHYPAVLDALPNRVGLHIRPVKDELGVPGHALHPRGEGVRLVVIVEFAAPHEVVDGLFDHTASL